MTNYKPKKKTGGKTHNQAGAQALEQTEELDPEKIVEQTLQRLPGHEVLPPQRFTKTTILGVETAKINEITQMLYLPPSLSEEIKEARIFRAMELYQSLEPKDGAEGMLATQMVGTHHAALECLRRAAVPEQTYAGRDMALKHAQKLMALYAKQLETLNKHRGKGQQKVTVEHVNVAAGGQAIVGNVAVGAKKQAEPLAEPQSGAKAGAIEQVEHQPLMPLIPMKTGKAPEKTRIQKSRK